MEKISAVYQIINEVTGDRYVGSSKNVERRWAEHKRPSQWKPHPNSLLYHDMQKYGVDKFRFQILAPVEPEYLTQVEQEFIEMLKPTYNDRRSKGLDVKRHKESLRKCRQSAKYKDYQREYNQSDKGKEAMRKYNKNYLSQMCLYNGKELTLDALRKRFSKAGFPRPVEEAKKYLLNK